MERLYRVRTPEMVDFSFPVAGLGSRFLAYVVDVALVAAIGFLSFCALGFLGVIASSASAFAGSAFLSVGIFLFFFLQWGYFVAWEAIKDGRTPGKAILGLRSIGERGTRITLAQSAIRNLFRALDALPALPVGPGCYFLGVLSHAASGSGQRIGDRVAGTVVIREERRDVPRRIGFPEARYNTLLEDRNLATRIARSIRADEKEVLLEVLLRRDELELATRTELFSQLARHLEERLDLPRDRFLSDEKLVMNVTQALVQESAWGNTASGAAWGSSASGSAPPAPGAPAELVA
ncbi:MAG TPA: RDD family protein [Planctomycetota bacterium]|nr:RDD family protein [Planctomycetota bacterium]